MEKFICYSFKENCQPEKRAKSWTTRPYTNRIGLLIFLYWRIKCSGITLVVTDKRTTLRTGILSKSITEVYHSDVRSIQVSQSLFQRILGVGSIGISSAGQSGIEIAADGIPDPNRVRELIDAHRTQRE